MATKSFLQLAIEKAHAEGDDAMVARLIAARDKTNRPVVPGPKKEP